MTADRRILAGLLGVALLGVTGCPPPKVVAPFEPIPAREALRIVNANAAGIHATLQATGSVDGRGPDDSGKLKSYHVSGTLFFLAPHNLRFDLKKLGTRHLLLGANETHFWVVPKGSEPLCARHESPAEWSAQFPARPQDLIDALVLSPIDIDPSSYVQRIVDDYQQVMVFEVDTGGWRYIAREYWIDRRPPFLVRRVILRDRDGAPRMDVALSDFRRVASDGPWLPYEVNAVWPTERATMEFRVRRWRFVDRVTKNSVQFAPPSVCE